MAGQDHTDSWCWRLAGPHSRSLNRFVVRRASKNCDDNPSASEITDRDGASSLVSLDHARVKRHLAVIMAILDSDIAPSDDESVEVLYTVPTVRTKGSKQSFTRHGSGLAKAAPAALLPRHALRPLLHASGLET
nr:hypothetical protein CFP56_53327 [Quercus suber]